MHFGKAGVVRHGGDNEPIAHIQSWNLDEEADPVSGWGMGDEYETTDTTIKRWNGSVEAYYNEADASADIEVGKRYPFEFYPGGVSTGSGYFSGQALVTGIQRSGSKDGIVSITLNLKGSGPLNSGAAS